MVVINCFLSNFYVNFALNKRNLLLMKRLTILFILFFVISCKEISFKEQQPTGRKALKSVPKNLHGKYLGLEENGEPAKDTIVITARGYYFVYANKAEHGQSEYDEGVLNDSLVLKSFKGYYFLNINKD